MGTTLGLIHMFKAYIITTPCSGKTSFTLQNAGSIGDISLLDQDTISSRLVRTGMISPNAHEDDKANIIIEYLKSQKESSILFGSYLPSNPLDYPEITVICVVLPKLKQFYYVIKRRLRYVIYQKLHFLPAYSNFEPDIRWSRWSDISKCRKNILVYAHNHNVPVFNNLQVATRCLDQH